MYQYNEDALCLLKQVCLHASFTVHAMIHIFDSKLPSSCLLLQLQPTGQGAWFVLRASNLPCRNGSEQQIKQNIRRRQVTKQGISSLVCCAKFLY